MVRHTGDYLLGTMFLAAAMILQLSNASVQSAAPRMAILDHSETAARTASPLQTLISTPAVEPIPSPAVNAVLTNLSRGTRIVVGSLDLSGARHQILLKSQNDGSLKDKNLTVARFSTESLSHHDGLERILSSSSNGKSDKKAAVVRTTAYAMPPDDIEPASSVSQAVLSRTAAAESTRETLVTRNVNSQPWIPTVDLSSRVFLVPHFSDTATIHKPAECRAIGEGHKVRVYVDQCSPQLAVPDQMRSWCELLLSKVEHTALPIAEKWIGPVRDVDGSQKLSIVVTDLDQYGRQPAGRSPIYGCIRENDFCPESDFCGDIVYIDHDIFELPAAEVAALLTHEIVHAAICSMSDSVRRHETADFRENAGLDAACATTSVPPWMNEAVAHLVELQCRDTMKMPLNATEQFVTKNFQRRIDAFLAGSDRSPIVASENVLNMEERRSGSRGAGTLFLARLISTPHDVQTLLRTNASLERRIERVAQRPFADVFRNWTLSLASTSSGTALLSVERLAADFESRHCSLLGTAFHCLECSEDIDTLVLVSDESAQLQISVIEPAVRNTQIAQSNP